MADKPKIDHDERLDITESVCPETVVRIKEAMFGLRAGQTLSIRMNDGEPVQNIPKSLKEDGQRVLRLNDNKDGTYELIVRKDSD